MLEQSTNEEPFPGLRPFKTCEDHLFFGRDEHVYSMIDRLQSTRFLTLIGVSGSGKSSLINCGLRPALHQGYMASAGSEWHIAACRPGSTPIENLKQAIKTDLGLELDESILRDETLAEDGSRQGGLIKSFGPAYDFSPIAGGNVLLIVDQFEEIFRYIEEGASLEQANTFVQLLLEVFHQGTYPIYVTVGMRSDYLGHCAQFEGLPQSINKSVFLIPRLTTKESRMVIRGPIKVVQPEVDIEDELIELLTSELNKKPDQLTILQHALNRTWHFWNTERKSKGWQPGAISVYHYESVGKISFAINNHAEQIFKELNSERDELICKVLFKALTQKNLEGRAIRRPRRLTVLQDLVNAAAEKQLNQKVTMEDVSSVINMFRKSGVNFLFSDADSLDDCDENTVSSMSDLHGHNFIDIAHENLVEYWGRLKDWVDEEAHAVERYNQLARLAGAYRKIDINKLTELLISAGDNLEELILEDWELQVGLHSWSRNKKIAPLAEQWPIQEDGEEKFVNPIEVMKYVKRNKLLQGQKLQNYQDWWSGKTVTRNGLLYMEKNKGSNGLIPFCTNAM